MPERKRGRPPKFEADEVRRLLIDAGVEAVEQAGVTRGLDAVNLDAALRATNVPRGAAYRAWGGNTTAPQDEYRLAVLLEILRMTPTSAGLQFTEGVIDDELRRHSEALGSNDRERLNVAARAMIRVVGAANFRRLEKSPKWFIYRAAAFSAGTRPDELPEVLEAVRYGEEVLIDDYGRMFEAMAELFHYRLRSEYRLSEFTMSVYALNDGLAASVGRTHRLWGIERATGPHGEMEEWSLFAVGVEAMIDQFFEPIEPINPKTGQ